MLGGMDIIVQNASGDSIVVDAPIKHGINGVGLILRSTPEKIDERLRRNLIKRPLASPLRCDEKTVESRIALQGQE